MPQEARVQPDAVVYNTLITLAGRAGQLQRALEVVSEMEVRLRPRGVQMFSSRRVCCMVPCSVFA